MFDLKTTTTMSCFSPAGLYLIPPGFSPYSRSLQILRRQTQNNSADELVCLCWATFALLEATISASSSSDYAGSASKNVAPPRTYVNLDVVPRDLVTCCNKFEAVSLGILIKALTKDFRAFRLSLPCGPSNARWISREKREGEMEQDYESKIKFF